MLQCYVYPIILRMDISIGLYTAAQQPASPMLTLIMQIFSELSVLPRDSTNSI